MSLPENFELITKNVYLIHEKMFPVYLITGSRNYLIDCAISPYGESLLTRIRTILGNSPLHHVLLTHSHYDHTGACLYLQREFGFSVSGSQRTIELLKKKKVNDYIKRLNKNFEEILDIRTENIPGTLKDLVSLKNGEIIELDKNRYIKVISTPGHTKCSVSYLLMPDKILFPGDAAGVMERKGKIKPLFFSDFSEYQRSLKKLILTGSEMLCLPHNRYIKGKARVKQFLTESLTQTERTGDIIKRALEKSDDPKIISDQILAREFPNPAIEGPEEAFTINLESMVNAVKKEL